MSLALATGPRSTLGIVRLLLQYRNTLSAVTRVELAKKYSGSVFGKVWITLYPILLLSIYLFVYMIVFKMQLAGSTRLGYVIYVFAGLIPYIGFMEAVTSGCTSLKQNMHLIKNVMLPIELIPARYVFVAMVGEFVGLIMLLVLIAANGGLSLRLFMIPLALGLQTIMLIGLVLVLAPLGVLLPDLAYFVNLAVLLLIFISPIGFTLEAVPSAFSFLIYLNPLFYMIDGFRWVLLENHPFKAISAIGYTGFSIGIFAFGSWFFTKLKRIMVDFE